MREKRKIEREKGNEKGQREGEREEEGGREREREGDGGRKILTCSITSKQAFGESQMKRKNPGEKKNSLGREKEKGGLFYKREFCQTRKYTFWGSKNHTIQNWRK